MTLMELAAEADMDLTVLNRVENGVRSIRLRDAVCIARCLGVKVESLCKRQTGVAYG